MVRKQNTNIKKLKIFYWLYKIGLTSFFCLYGNSRVITPVNQCWDSWFDASPTSSEFMIDREQPLEVRRMFNIHSGAISLSTVTLGELVHGVKNQIINNRIESHWRGL